MLFANRDLKNKLSVKYKVQGIPTLVILDENGDVITKDGRSAVMKDPEAFRGPRPPSPRRWADPCSSRRRVSLASMAKSGANVGVYFSAHWCGPCRQFTPKLIEAYDKMLGDPAKPFEVIFVSGDRDHPGSGGLWIHAVARGALRRREAPGRAQRVLRGPGHPPLRHADFRVEDDQPQRARVGDVRPNVRGVSLEAQARHRRRRGLRGINDTTTVVLLMEECGDDWDDLTAAITAVAKDVKEAEEARARMSAPRCL